MKRLSIIFSLGIMALSAGCRAQVPPSPAPTVALTWTAASTCTTAAPCTYVISRAVCPTASTCPTVFTPLNQASPVSGTAYTDTPPTGVLVLYIGQTVQTGLVSVASAPSNGGVPISIPSLPSAPGAPSPRLNTAQLAPLVHEALPPIVASVDLPQPMQLMAIVKKSN